ncbi:MAG: efflux RND transporter periplasmic adaptor subunit [Gammaproteobacteria bacterium]|nr:efflux RND transporter periplasmic adaptor subunit [Gammaproteobacteria bacterium]
MAEPSSYAPDEHLRRRIRRYSLALLLLALTLAAWGIASRVAARDALARQTAAAAAVTVEVVRPAPSRTGDDLVLPGTVKAYVEAPIYARTSGYLHAWYTDIGTPVRKGQLLASIDTPEVDQQLVQARADLATARANLAIARSTSARWQKLLATDSVSRQDAEQKAAAAAAAAATERAAAANLARLGELEGFKRVVAPFDGIVTARNTDVGALINAGQTPGAALFDVADIHALRIYVEVPEAYAAAATVGTPAILRFAEFPGRSFRAVTTHTAGALDPVTRTLQVELRLDNARREIFPGAYAEVHFRLSADRGTLRLPANTVLFRGAGLEVATVDRDRRIRLKRIEQGRDFGSTIEVLSGLDPRDLVIVNPPDSSVDGEAVRVLNQGAATHAAPGAGT